jgi:DNA-binding GntR family transcriptional regulator
MTINALSKSKKIYNLIIKEIVTGEIFPGQRLTERELIAKYGMSKTPIREALNKLEENGIVTYELNKGFSVVRMSHDDVEEIYELREVLEGLAAKKVVEKLELTIIQDKNIIENFRLSEECLKNNDIQKYSILDMEFHHLLADMSGNYRLKSMLDKLYYQAKLLLSTSLYLPGRDIGISFNEHKDIVEAISNKDIVNTERKARAHVKNVKTAVLNWIDKKNYYDYT